MNLFVGNLVPPRRIAHVLAAGVLAATLTGCGAPTPGWASPAAGPATATTPAAAAPAPRPDPAQVAGCAGGLTTATATVEVAARVVEGRAEPAPQRIDVVLGAPVVLRVEADTPTEVHVHGYDRVADAAPGAPACLEFVADVPGMFEVEAHPHTLLVQLAVR
jgi:hypothetical protein